MRLPDVSFGLAEEEVLLCVEKGMWMGKFQAYDFRVCGVGEEDDFCWKRETHVATVRSEKFVVQEECSNETGEAIEEPN